MRRTRIITPLVAALAIAPAGAHAATVRLTPANATFPNRAYVLTLPAGTSIGPQDVSVSENGRGVDGLTVRPATGRFGVVLAIDTSPSMRGRPIAGAMAAA